MKFFRKRLPVFIVFLLVFVCLTATEAKATVFSVTNLNDSGAGSLRQAITDANSAPGEHTINFQAGLTGTISLQSALPSLAVPMIINGPGADILNVRRGGGGAYRIFHVASAVVLNGLTISGGFAPNTGEPKFTVRRGSGISAQGSLVLNNCRVTENSASGSIIEGAGIYNTGALVVRNSEVTNNSLFYFGSAGHSYGSGIYNEGIAIVEDSTFSGNSGAAAIHNARGMTISRSSITNNINTPNNFGTMGIFSFTQVQGIPNSILIENSTISGNSGTGAWLYSNSPMEVRSSTITNNQNYGLLVSGTGRIDNNIIAGNINKDAVGNFTANSSYNLIGKGEDSNLVNGQNGNIVGTTAAPVNAQLAPLGNYGGRTQTHRLLNTSPAINAANPIEFPATDQRGVLRSVGGSPDIGAFEFNMTPPRYLPRAGLNSFYSQTLRAFSNAPGQDATFAISEGSLPPGMFFQQLQTPIPGAINLRGTPEATGTFNFTVMAIMSGGFTISTNYSLTIQNTVSFVRVGGRVTTNEGKPVSRAQVLMYDANGIVIKRAFTNPFGYYRLNGVQAGESYSFKVVAKNRRFAQQNITVNGEMNDFNFIAEP